MFFGRNKKKYRYFLVEKRALSGDMHEFPVSSIPMKNLEY